MNALLALTPLTLLGPELRDRLRCAAMLQWPSAPETVLTVKVVEYHDNQRMADGRNRAKVQTNNNHHTKDADMKKITRLLTLGFLLPLAAQAEPPATPQAPGQAQVSPDLRYRHDPVKDLALLKDYDGEPWYGMLANCAGYYTAASETPGVPPQVSQALRKQANFFATVASFRLARDRGLEMTIHEPVVTIAEKASANALARGLVSTPERQDSMRMLCGGHLNAYERMVPGMELQ